MTPQPQIGLLDTSVVIDLPRLSVEDLPAFPTISAITLAELGVGPHVAADARTRQQRQLVLQQAEASFDALIAATALANDLPLYTRNPSNFVEIDGLDVHSIED